MATEAQRRGVITIGSALVLGLVLIVAADASASQRRRGTATVRNEILAVAVALESYRLDHGNYPRGNNFTITQALLGRHSPGESRVYLMVKSRQLDDKGRLLDPWGRPYEMTLNEVNGTVRMRSAGPDGLLDPGHGGDDIRSWDAPVSAPRDR